MSRSAPPSELLRQLADPASAETAAALLAANPSWRCGRPPPAALVAFGDPQYPLDGAVVGLACAWEAESLVPLLLQAIADDNDLQRRRRLAWIAKQIATARTAAKLLAMACVSAEDRVVRRYLLEALSRLAFAGEVGWPAIAASVRVLVCDPDALIREAAVALAGIGDDAAAERRDLLLASLADTDAAVLATAATALRRHGVRASDVPAALLGKLLDHPQPLVRLAVRDLLGGPGHRQKPEG